MEPDFWHQRWHEGRIGFHQERISPLLEAHWQAVGVPSDGRVFVPLCGKSLDMHWLAELGYRVLGVELSPIAVEAFFEAQGLVPTVHESRYGLHHLAGPYELVVGDAFALDAEALAGCTAVFDRAALIALPPDMRRRYLHELYGRLPSGCRGLMVTLEYPPHEKAGPPFPVDEAEVRARLADTWQVDLLERRDILADEPGFAAEGVTALSTCAYRLEKRS
ncbi:MAG TPA: thiopurine S-methyltransferase [Xanthomonadaceae bacterium]|nr:thiopurine S-methyltransferase [Xanthomonadaceae bacterium]